MHGFRIILFFAFSILCCKGSVLRCTTVPEISVGSRDFNREFRNATPQKQTEMAYYFVKSYIFSFYTLNPQFHQYASNICLLHDSLSEIQSLLPKDLSEIKSSIVQHFFNDIVTNQKLDLENPLNHLDFLIKCLITMVPDINKLQFPVRIEDASVILKGLFRLIPPCKPMVTLLIWFYNKFPLSELSLFFDLIIDFFGIERGFFPMFEPRPNDNVAEFCQHLQHYTTRGQEALKKNLADSMTNESTAFLRAYFLALLSSSFSPSFTQMILSLIPYISLKDIILGVNFSRFLTAYINARGSNEVTEAILKLVLSEDVKTILHFDTEHYVSYFEIVDKYQSKMPESFQLQYSTLSEAATDAFEAITDRAKSLESLTRKLEIIKSSVRKISTLTQNEFNYLTGLANEIKSDSLKYYTIASDVQNPVCDTLENIHAFILHKRISSQNDTSYLLQFLLSFYELVPNAAKLSFNDHFWNEFMSFFIKNLRIISPELARTCFEKFKSQLIFSMTEIQACSSSVDYSFHFRFIQALGLDVEAEIYQIFVAVLIKGPNPNLLTDVVESCRKLKLSASQLFSEALSILLKDHLSILIHTPAFVKSKLALKALSRFMIENRLIDSVQLSMYLTIVNINK